MSKSYPQVWDLDVFYQGGSHSPAFKAELEEIVKQLEVFAHDVNHWENASPKQLSSIIEIVAEVSQRLEQASSFVGCLQAANSEDIQANDLRREVMDVYATYETIETKLDEKILAINDHDWEQLLQYENIRELQFVLNEKRSLAKDKLSQQQEALISNLSVDGYYAWEEMYDLLVSQIKIPFELDGKKELLSAGQADNLFAHTDKEIRKEIFEKWEQAWGEQTSTFSTVLNHLSGFRLAVYKERGWDDTLKEALSYNRMQKETLDVMWEVISENKQPFIDFLQKKAELLGVKQMSWADLEAPVGNTDTDYSYDAGAEFILKNFSQFGEELTNFSKHALENSWVEAENRPNKSPGGFCTAFPLSKQSRIFMTYSGSLSNVSTLAHELGHAFHTYTLNDVHPLNMNYAMNVAETASTFAETIVTDAAVNQAKSNEEKVHLLNEKISLSVALFMNIHARFLFETRFYEERKNGSVSIERLNELMESAQKEAYADSLSEYHPTFWASKLHFFITGVPFYNFPYTFGYLFALGIYAQAKKEGKDYEKKYIALLQDTGSMSVEDLAMKHLDVDLTKREFWEAGMKLCIKDVEKFMELI